MTVVVVQAVQAGQKAPVTLTVSYGQLGSVSPVCTAQRQDSQAFFSSSLLLRGQVTTWNNEHYEFHGQCDLVMMSDLSFAGDDAGLDIHIRTKLVRFWSYIKTVAIRIGNDILEIEGSIEGGSKEFINTRPTLNFKGSSPKLEDSLCQQSRQAQKRESMRLISVASIPTEHSNQDIQ